MCIRFQKSFDKKFIKLRTSEQKRVRERIHIFLDNPFNPILRNHPLQGAHTGYRSINITGDLRAVYKLLDDGTVLFVAVDTHSNLYS